MFGRDPINKTQNKISFDYVYCNALENRLTEQSIYINTLLTQNHTGIYLHYFKFREHPF